LLVVMAAACGGGGDKAASRGDADVAAGKALFEKTVLGSSAGCVTCHSREPGKTIVGPSLPESPAKARISSANPS
jgi:cytochrome c551/c552